MRRWQNNVLFPVLAATAFAEAAAWCGAWLAGPDKSCFQLFMIFHRPALALAGFLVPELYEDDPNLSVLEGAIVWVAVIAGALMQWFLIFLSFALLRRHFAGKRNEKAFAV